MEVRLDGRTALITGGSLGLGKAMAMMFADSGAKVDILDSAGFRRKVRSAHSASLGRI